MACDEFTDLYRPVDECDASVNVELTCREPCEDICGKKALSETAAS